MTQLGANKPRAFELGDKNMLPVKAAVAIYEGSAVGDDAAGYARQLVSGDPFRGFAMDKADNAAGAAGDILVEVKRKGAIVLPVTSAAITDVGRPVFASDGNAFALDGLGTYIGVVARYISAGVALVEFDADRPEKIVPVTFPIALAGVTAADVLTTITPGFDGRVKSFDAFVETVATTAAKLATLNLEIGTTNITGGTIALTSANCTPLGAKVAGAAITAANAFRATDTLSIEAASVTAFVEGRIFAVATLGQPG